MYYCENCKNEFVEPIIEDITQEDFYGVDNLFENLHKIKIEKCPHCKSDGCFEEMKICDVCGEYCRECDLLDTEELAGGGIGFLCWDCARDNGFGGGD